MIEPNWERLAVVPGKADVLSTDLYFRECWADFVDIFGSHAESVLGSIAMMNMKPDAVVGRRTRAALDFVVAHGFRPIAVAPVQMTRHSMRELWRYDWHVYPTDRLAFSTLWYTSAEVLVFLLEDVRREGAVPATSRLSDLKGSAVPEKRRPGQMRSVLRPANRLLNFVHVAEEPGDVVRELAIFFDRDERRTLLGDIAEHRDADRYANAVEWIERLEALHPPHDLDFEASLARIEQSNGDGVGRLRARLLEVEKMGWDELCSMIDPAKTDRWDFIVVASNVILFERSVPEIFPPLDLRMYAR